MGENWKRMVLAFDVFGVWSRMGLLLQAKTDVLARV